MGCPIWGQKPEIFFRKIFQRDCRPFSHIRPNLMILRDLRVWCWTGRYLPRPLSDVSRLLVGFFLNLRWKSSLIRRHRQKTGHSSPSDRTTKKKTIPPSVISSVLFCCSLYFRLRNKRSYSRAKLGHVVSFRNRNSFHFFLKFQTRNFFLTRSSQQKFASTCFYNKSRCKKIFSDS